MPSAGELKRGKTAPNRPHPSLFTKEAFLLDKIILQDMAFYGYHGALAAEKELGQRFQVTVKIFLNLRPAARSDQLQKTLNYARVYREIQKIVEGRPFNLLEALAEAIAARLLSLGAPAVQVRVKKMHPPFPGQLSYVAVEITRSRSRQKQA